MARKVKLKTNLGNVRSHTLQVFEEIASKWAIWYAWGIGPTGEHAQGRALDFMTLTENQQAYRDKVGDEIANYLWKHRKRLGVWYVIWNRRIISMTYESSGWRSYTGSNPHTDHVHVSFYNGVSYKPPSGSGGNNNKKDWFDLASKKDLKQVVQQVVKQEVGKAVWNYKLNAVDGSYDKDKMPAATHLRYARHHAREARKQTKDIGSQVWYKMELDDPLNEGNEKISPATAVRYSFAWSNQNRTRLNQVIDGLRTLFGKVDGHNKESREFYALMTETPEQTLKRLGENGKRKAE